MNYGILNTVTTNKVRINFLHPARVMLFVTGLVYCFLAILYAVLVPPWEAPDEPAHYLYVSQLATRWRPPIESKVYQIDFVSRDYAFISSNYEWYQPALGYLPGALFYRVLASIAPDSLPREIPPLNPLAFPEPITNHNFFLHANPNPIAIWDGSWGLLIIRILSTFWGLIVIWTTYRMGRFLDNENGFLGIAAAGYVAFLPQFTFINASVRNDTVTNALAALVLLQAALLQISREHRDKNALVTGILLALGLLSKHTFVYMVPIGLLAAILPEPHSPRTWIKPLVLMLTPILVLCGAYYVAFDESRAELAYTWTTALKVRPDALTWAYLKDIPVPLLTDLFYARFGWANVVLPEVWTRLPFGVWAVGAAITLIQGSRLVHKCDERPPLKIIALLIASILLAVVGVIRFNLAVLQPQGRLLFPVLAAWAIIGFWGVSQSLTARSQMVVAMFTSSLMLIFNLYSLFWYLVPAYY